MNKRRKRNVRRTASKLTIASVAGSAVPALGGSGSGSGGLLSGMSFGTIGGIIDQLGGVQGIIGAITKARSVLASFRQFAPLLKVLWGAFSKKSDGVEQQATDDAEPTDSWLAEDGLLPPSPAAKKRRARKRKPSGRRKTAKKKAA